MWINDAVRGPGKMRTEHIKTLMMRKIRSKRKAKNLICNTRSELARHKAKRKAINEELTSLGCMGYDSSDSDESDEDEAVE